MADARVLFSVLSDSAIYQFIPADPPASPEELKERFRRYCQGPVQEHNEEWLNWMVSLEPEGIPVGTVQATIFQTTHSASIAYLFGPLFWRQGLATEAVGALTQWLIGQKVRSVTADIDVRNQSSIRLVRRLGFRLVSVRPKADFFKGGSSDEYSFVYDRHDVLST